MTGMFTKCFNGIIFCCASLSSRAEQFILLQSGTRSHKEAALQRERSIFGPWSSFPTRIFLGTKWETRGRLNRCCRAAPSAFSLIRHPADGAGGFGPSNKSQKGKGEKSKRQQRIQEDTAGWAGGQGRGRQDENRRRGQRSAGTRPKPRSRSNAGKAALAREKRG